MTTRYTKADAENAFARLADYLNLDTAARNGPIWTRNEDGTGSTARVGAMYLDCNSHYGGCIVEEIDTSSGGIRQPFSRRRQTPREFCQSVNFTLDVLNEQRRRENPKYRVVAWTGPLSTDQQTLRRDLNAAEATEYAQSLIDADNPLHRSVEILNQHNGETVMTHKFDRSFTS